MNLRKLYWRLRKPKNIREALRQIVDTQDLEQCKNLASSDLLEFVASSKKFDPGSLLLALANLLEVKPCLEELEVDESLIASIGLPKQYLETNFLLPAKGNILAVTDINKDNLALSKNFKLKLNLATKTNIEQSWFKFNLKSVSTEDIERVLKQLVVDADTLGASTIDLDPEDGSYQFVADEQVYDGKIHKLIIEGLKNWLEGKSKVKVKMLGDDKVVFSREAQNIKVFWNDKKNILLLEDDKLYAKVLKSTLEKNDYIVHVFFEAEDALDALENLKPDLVISDLNLPGMQGDQFVDAYKSKYSKTPFIILTSDREELKEVDLISKGIGAYLNKGSDIRVILAWCEQLLGKTPSAVSGDK